MEHLIDQLSDFRRKLPPNDAERLSDELLANLHNVYPFNKFEYLIAHLIAEGVLNLEEYNNMRADYIERNKYLYLFELAPRTFGQEWGERHLMELVQEFKVPRTAVDPTYAGEYDLWLDGVKVEVKASRAVRKAPGDSLAEKALLFGSDERFDMNFQQLKPGCCDVFIWIAVWRNKIDYWMLTAEDVATHPLFSNQHRASQLSESGEVIEGQIHINNRNYDDFEKYRIRPDEIKERISAFGQLKKNA